MLITRWQASVLPSLDQVKQIFEMEGLKPLIEEYEPHSKVNVHRHYFDEVRIVINGELHLNISGNQLKLSPGDRIEIPSNTKHSTWVEGESPCLCLYAKRPFRI